MIFFWSHLWWSLVCIWKWFCLLMFLNWDCTIVYLQKFNVSNCIFSWALLSLQSMSNKVKLQLNGSTLIRFSIFSIRLEKKNLNCLSVIFLLYKWSINFNLEFDGMNWNIEIIFNSNDIQIKFGIFIQTYIGFHFWKKIVQMIVWLIDCLLLSLHFNCKHFHFISIENKQETPYLTFWMWFPLIVFFFSIGRNNTFKTVGCLITPKSL